MTSNTVKYTSPARCVYSNETGCEKQVVWYTGGGLSLPLDAETKDHHDCRKKKPVNRIPDAILEPEAYRRYINAQKDREWAEAMREPSQIRKMGMTTEQILQRQMEAAAKKHYISEVCIMCTKQIFRERGGYDTNWKEKGAGPAFDDESATKVHDCLEGVNERNVQILNTKIKLLEDRTQQQEKAYERRLKNLEQYIGRAFF